MHIRHVSNDRNKPSSFVTSLDLTTTFIEGGGGISLLSWSSRTQLKDTRRNTRSPALPNNFEMIRWHLFIFFAGHFNFFVVVFLCHLLLLLCPVYLIRHTHVMETRSFQILLGNRKIFLRNFFFYIFFLIKTVCIVILLHTHRISDS